MIWIILLVALILRVVTLNQSLWLDEADNVVATSMFNFISFITEYPIGDYHPPGYFALLWIWINFFGSSEISVRLPSVFLGVGTVYFTYLLGKQLFDEKVAILASIFLAIAPLHVYYSQEARMYSLSAFSVSMLSYFLLQLQSGKKWAMVGYTTGAILVLYSDYVTYLIFFPHFIYLLSVKHAIWKRWLTSLLISCISFLPWLGVFHQQVVEGQEASLNLPGWKSVAGGADFKNLALVWIKTVVGRISFENKIVYAGIIGTLSVLWGIGVIRGIRQIGGIWDSRVKFLLLWLIVPLFLSWGISFYIPMLSYFRMVYILPAFYLLSSYGFTTLPNMFAKLSIAALCLSSLIFLGLYYTNPSFQRENWREAVGFFNNISKDKVIVLFEDNHVKFPYLYYQKNMIPAFGGLKNIQAKSTGDIRDIEKLLEGRKQIYLFEYLVEITDPQRLLQERIIQMGFTPKNIYNFSGVGLVRQYERIY